MRMSDPFRQLTRDELAAAIEWRWPPRVPLVMARWWGEGLREQYGDRLRPIETRYPEDAAFLIDPPGTSAPREVYSWYRAADSVGRGYDANGILDDWCHLEEFLEKLPDPKTPGLFDRHIEAAEAARAEGRYVLTGWWNLFFERPWDLMSAPGGENGSSAERAPLASRIFERGNHRTLAGFSVLKIPAGAIISRRRRRRPRAGRKGNAHGEFRQGPDAAGTPQGDVGGGCVVSPMPRWRNSGIKRALPAA